MNVATAKDLAEEVSKGSGSTAFLNHVRDFYPLALDVVQAAEDLPAKPTAAQLKALRSAVAEWKAAD